MDNRMLLAKGWRSEVYAWSNNQVLKLFYDSISPESVEREARSTQMVYNIGVRTPRVDEIIEFDGRSGIVFERIDGPTMQEVLITQPWRVRSLARSFAELHYTIHQYSGPEFDSVRNVLAQYIHQADDVFTDMRQKALEVLSKIHYFTIHQYIRPEFFSARNMIEQSIHQADEMFAELKQKALDTLLKLSDDDCLCHGDLRPDHVIVSSEGLVMIDWETAVRGAKLSDVAYTSVHLRIVDIPSDMSVVKRLLLKVLRNVFINEYLRHYLQLSGASREELKTWELVFAVVRLIKVTAHARETEKRRVLKLLKERL